jgi:hypothetical protein
MKITANEQAIEASGLGQTSNFGIKNSAAAFQLLSSGLYTNKIRAVLREIGCNGVDAHVLNGKQNTPIEVKLPNRLDNQFHIRDFGPGLSHDQIMRLYSTYFDSTKQASDDYIGGFGVGSKSPFAYTDSFTVVSRHKGIERVYAAFVNDEGMPTIATMSEETSTTELSGLQVGFPVRPEDLNAFESEAREVYSGFKVQPTILGANLRLEDYAAKPIIDGVASLRGDSYHRRELLLNMGGVRYPLNSFAEKLRNTNRELTPEAQWLYDQGVEIDVPIGSVSVAASREALQYDKKTMANIPEIMHNAAVRCLTELKNVLNAIDAKKPAIERATELEKVLDTKGSLAWMRLPSQAMKNLFPDSADFMACQMALLGKYTVDTSPYPALHVWRMNHSLQERIHEHGLKGAKIDNYEGRKKVLTALRRNWNQASATDHARDSIFSHTTHSIVMPKAGGIAPIVKHTMPEFQLGAQMTVLETSKPVVLETLLENHQAQPSLDYNSRHHKKYVVSPVPQYKDGKPLALSATQMQEFETQKEEFYRQYSIKPETMIPLPVVTAPPKAKAIPAVWTVPLDIRDHASLKRTLRGIPSSDVGESHTQISTDEMAYVLYDRKASQDELQKAGGGFSRTDLAIQSSKYRDYLQQAVFLRDKKIPTDVHLLDKKDLSAFKKVYPNAQSFEDYLQNLRQDPVFLAEVLDWSNNRPKIVHMDHHAQLWLGYAEKMPTLSPGSLLGQLAEQWKQHATADSDSYGADARRRNFYSLLLDTSYPENTLINTYDDVKQLNDVYPYMRFFNYNIPENMKYEYITDVNNKWGWMEKGMNPTEPKPT